MNRFQYIFSDIFSKKSFLFIFFVLVISGFAYGLREYALKTMIADIDEPFYTNISLEYANFIREGDLKSIVWYRKNNEHPSLVKILYGFVLTGTEKIDQLHKKDFEMLKPISVDAQSYVFRVRRTSAIIGTLTVFFSALLSPLSAFLLAIQNTAIHYSSVYYLEALPTLFSSLTIFSYLRWKKKRLNLFHKTIIDLKNDQWLYISALFLGLTAACKYVYALIGLIVIVDYLFDLIVEKTLTKEALLKFFLWGIVAIGLFFVFNPILWPKPIDRLVDSIQFHLNYAQSQDVTKYGYPFWQPLIWLTGPENRYKPALPIQLDTFILILAVIGLPTLYKKNRTIFLWLVFSFGFLLIWNTKWPQYIMTTVTPVCFSAGAALDRFVISPFWKKIKSTQWFSAYNGM